MIRFRFRGNPLAAPVPRGSACDDLRDRIGAILGRSPVVSRRADYEDWTESASMLAAIASCGLEISVEWADPKTGEPGETRLLGRACAESFLGVRFASDELLRPVWPVRADISLAARYPESETFRRMAGRRTAIADMPGDDGASLVSALAGFVGTSVVIKHFLPVKAHPPIFMDLPERITDDIIWDVFSDDPLHVVNHEGRPRCILVQDRLDLRKETRFFLARGEPVSGAGCVREHTPLQRDPANVVGITHAVFRDRVSDKDLVTDRRAASVMEEFVRRAGADLYAELPDLEHVVIDVAMSGDEPVIVEMNPYQASGLYANDAAAVAAPVIRHIAASPIGPEPAPRPLSEPDPVPTVIAGSSLFDEMMEDAIKWRKSLMSEKFGYYVNLDERGEFYADVRNESGDTVFEIRLPDEEGGSIIEDGFMRDKEDISGLQSYLIDLKVLPEDAELLASRDFEAALEEDDPEADDLEP